MANLKNTTINDTVFKLPSGDTAARPTGTNGAQLRFNTETGKLEQFRPGVGAWIAPSNTGVIATGGDAVYDVDAEGTTYRVHVFTSTGTSTFSVLQGGEAEYLIVAGGGGGGGRIGAGGGAGGILTGTFGVTTQIYSISVGAGGSGGNGSPSGPIATNGNDSSFTGNFIATGGGFGAGSENDGESGGDGGSGGGGQRGGTSNGGSGTAGQGNDGGDGSVDARGSGGGGGGAGAPGTNGSTSSGGDGGDGIQSSISGSSVFYGGGGGAGSGLDVPDDNFGTGGAGGGANGSYNVDADAGVTNSGGGGGGGGYDGSGHDGGNGGSGIVIIRYPLRQNNPETAAGQDVGNGLVLDLDFAKPTVYSGSGTVVTDSRLTGVEGDINGAGFVNPRTHRSAFDFNGSNELIDTNEPTANLFRRAGSGSVVMWFKTSSTSRMTLVSGYPGSGTNRWDFEIENLRLQGLFHNSGFISGNIDIDSDVWTMASFSYDVSETLLSFYVNDQFDNSQNTSSQSLESNADLGIACRSDNSNFNFDGQIGIVKVFDRVLLLEEIQTIYDYTRWRFGV